MYGQDAMLMRQVAFVMAQVACALAEIEGMRALNSYREHRGETIGYTDDHFMAIPDKYGLGHNDVLTTLSP